ncbi:MAG: type II toxin-antitoxin system VapC family toxin [Ideonella sp.]|nr:type II toxin-antitoxin system VapC family toxin [Ideonella sp.]MCC7456818.1 type II toxin-antitoxin system VapC family toxin [Nitrospira sp.]
MSATRSAQKPGAARSAQKRVLYVAEPTPVYAAQRPAVVDCSLLAAVLWAEPAAEQARERIRDRSLHAPVLLAYELANVARNKCRAGVPAAAAREGLAAFAQQNVALHDDAPEALFDLAGQLDLTAYDAAYVALAQALQAPLLTFDKKLAEAAARLLGTS